MIFTTYAPRDDMTFIMEAKGNTLTCIGWYHGEPDAHSTELFKGDLTAKYDYDVESIYTNDDGIDCYSTGGGFWQAQKQAGGIYYAVNNELPECLNAYKDEEGNEMLFSIHSSVITNPEQMRIYEDLYQRLVNDSKEYDFKIYR